MQRENTESLALQSSWKMQESRVLPMSCRPSRPPQHGGSQLPSCKFPVTGQHLELLLLKISKPCANLSDFSLRHIMRQVPHYFTDKSTETQRLSGLPKITQQARVPQTPPSAGFVSLSIKPFWGSATLRQCYTWTQTPPWCSMMDQGEEKGQTEPPKLESGYLCLMNTGWGGESGRLTSFLL